jgi:DNA-directed RNA polymerase specialized sigma24 family protein
MKTLIQSRKRPKTIFRMVRAAAQRLCAYLLADTLAAARTGSEQEDGALASSSPKAPQRSRDQEADERRMWGALHSADSLTRDVFVLHRIHGYSHAQIASQLRMSLRDVEERVACVVVMLSIERQDPR